MGFTELEWVFLWFGLVLTWLNVFLPSFGGYQWVKSGSLGFSWVFIWARSGLTRFSWFFTRLDRVISSSGGFHGFYFVLLVFLGLKRILLDISHCCWGLNASQRNWIHDFIFNTFIKNDSLIGRNEQWFHFPISLFVCLFVFSSRCSPASSVLFLFMFFFIVIFFFQWT